MLQFNTLLARTYNMMNATNETAPILFKEGATQMDELASTMLSKDISKYATLARTENKISVETSDIAYIDETHLAAIVASAAMLPASEFCYYGYALDNPIKGQREIGACTDVIPEVMKDIYENLEPQKDIYLFIADPVKQSFRQILIGHVDSTRDTFHATWDSVRHSPVLEAAA